MVSSVYLRRRPVFAASFDITNRCNLKCQHCYFQKQDQPTELSAADWLTLFRRLRRAGVYHASFVGGEPLLRSAVVRAGTEIFPFNWLVTNGTLPLPRLPRTTIFVSIDGPAKVHDQIRGQGVYQQARQNIQDYASPVYLGTVINRLNKNYLEEIVTEWQTTNVAGINFDFHSPTTLRDPLSLAPAERDQTIRELQRLKAKYQNFILLSETVLKLLRSQNSSQVTKDCPLPKHVQSFDAAGQVKKPCILAGVSCQNCGCIIPFLGYAVTQIHDLPSIRLGWRMLT